MSKSELSSAKCITNHKITTACSRRRPEVTSRVLGPSLAPTRADLICLWDEHDATGTPADSEAGLEQAETDSAPPLPQRGHQLLELRSGTPIRIQLQGTRLCVGAKGKPCQWQRTLPPGKTSQCYNCQRQETAFYDFTGQAREHEPTAKYFSETTHNVYLALYDREHRKVGVTSRGLTRLLEQGASAALIFATDDGFGAREIEGKVRELDGITDRVQSSTRIQVIRDAPSESEAKQILEATLARVQDELPGLVTPLRKLHNFQYLFPTYDLRDVNGLGKISESLVEPELLKTIDPEEEINGLLLGAIGQMLVVAVEEGANEQGQSQLSLGGNTAIHVINTACSAATARRSSLAAPAGRRSATKPPSYLAAATRSVSVFSDQISSGTQERLLSMCTTAPSPSSLPTQRITPRFASSPSTPSSARFSLSAACTTSGSHCGCVSTKESPRTRTPGGSSGMSWL